mmetsp:Transcript_15790/g.28671  ORF Transcript_15790/g.28671 Transcript_15790/m.28671 type:complete len:153 (-) Transcript_15790:43-501(-)
MRSEKCPPAKVDCSDTCDSNMKTCNIVEGGTVPAMFDCACNNCVDDQCDLTTVDLAGYGDLTFPDCCSFSDRQTLICPGQCVTDSSTHAPTKSPDIETTQSPSKKPTKSPSGSPSNEPRVCVDDCDARGGGSCCTGRVCKANRKGRYPCKRS